ncbi:MAG: hypothetical protein KQH67_00025 [Bacteroidetes bacterium]|nr:hypothetical protein [Bacteroidota bacterium]
MKRILAILFVFSIYSFCIVQDQDDRIKELKQIIEYSISQDCYLTELSSYTPIEINSNEIIISIFFNNKTLESFWSPEVAVQYIFDAALRNIISAIWNTNFDKYNYINNIVFKVNVRPHDIPSLISFNLSFDVWKQFFNTGDKIELYKSITIIADGEPLKFDPYTAADIE